MGRIKRRPPISQIATTTAGTPPVVTQSANAPLLFHAFNPPNETSSNESDVTDTPALFASRYDWVTYNNSAFGWVNSMKAAGYNGKIGQYIFCHQSQVSGSMTNNIGGIYTSGIPSFAESDYIHNGSGARLYETGFGGVLIYSFKYESTTFRNWYFARMVNLIDATYGQPNPIIFLDNCRLTGLQMKSNQTNSTGSIQEYSNDDTTIKNANLDFITAMMTYIRANRPNARIVGNLIDWNDSSTAWDEYITPARLDGALYEYTFVKYSNLNWSAAMWLQILGQVESFTAKKKLFIAVAPYSTADNIGTGTVNVARQRFSYASYLLVFSEYVFFYYSGHPYGHTYHYSNYDLNLGKPTGARYRPDAGGQPNLWRRNFDRGYATADGGTQVGTITYTG